MSSPDMLQVKGIELLVHPWGSLSLILTSKYQLTFWAGTVAQIVRRLMHPRCVWEGLPSLRYGSYVCMTWCLRRSHISANKMVWPRAPQLVTREDDGDYSLLTVRAPCQHLHTPRDQKKNESFCLSDLAEQMLMHQSPIHLPFVVTVFIMLAKPTALATAGLLDARDHDTQGRLQEQSVSTTRIHMRMI